MAEPDTDVLTPDEEDEQRRRAKENNIAGSIGTPVARPGTVTTSPLPAPTIDRSKLPMVGEAPNMQPPEMPPSSPVSISGTHQIPPYPTPEQSKAAAMEAQGPPQYHGLNRVLDTIGQVIPGGAGVEAASGLGTIGHQVRLNRQEAAAGEEQGREKAALGEQESQAKIGEQEALGAEHEAQTGKTEAETGQIGKMSTVSVNGISYQVPMKDVEKLIGTNLSNETKQTTTAENVAGREIVAGKNQEGALQRERETNASKEKIAQWADYSREHTEEIRGKFQSGTLKWGMLDGKPVMFDGKTGQVVDTGALQPQPTSQTRAMGEQGGAISFMVPPLLEQIDALKDEIGPFAGRFDRAYVNRLGANDPAFASLDEGLQFFASGVARAHFGARGAAAATSEFKKYLTQSQSVDDLKARINTANDWMQNYARMAGAAGGGGGAAQPSAQPAAGGNKVLVEGKDF
jgi:hypothetical protein